MIIDVASIIAIVLNLYISNKQCLGFLLIMIKKTQGQVIRLFGKLKLLIILSIWAGTKLEADHLRSLIYE